MQNNNEHEIQKICQLNKNISVNIGFQNLSYSVRCGILGKKPILKSISGNFSTGELTGILGVSGSGKTSLLNILSGYTCRGVSGNILVNEKLRDIKLFHKVSVYIMQDDALQKLLSVKELMMMAGQLKLSSHISLQQKKLLIMEILQQLGLNGCLETRTENLSGGQRKRLSIALELVNNPPVIFLDEPTSGLDVVSIRQCMNIFKLLAMQGRTVICTIHQPSASTFELFDKVYFLHDGRCIYSGSPTNIVPFLSGCGYACPITHNPADHIVEIAQTVGESAGIFVDNIQNGQFDKSVKKVVDNETDAECKLESNMDIEFATSSWTQFRIILLRMMLQMKRSKSMLILLLMLHGPCTALAGLLFFQIGNNASLAVLNFKLCLTVVIFFVYIYLMANVILLPCEIRLLKREYINRWYGLKPYYLALTVKNLPVMVPLTLLYLSIYYTLAGYPLELLRFIRFGIAAFLIGVASEGLGTAIASVCDVTAGSITAAIFIAPLLLFAVYGVGCQTGVNILIEKFSYISYVRLGLIAICLALVADRPPLECPDEDYCYYKDLNDMLRDARLLNASYSANLIGLIVSVILFRLLAFMLLRFRLTPEYSNLVACAMEKITKNRNV